MARARKGGRTGYGDEVVAAGQAQRAYEMCGFRVSIEDCSGGRRWHPIWEGNPILIRPDEDVSHETIYQLPNGPGCRPYIVYPFNEHVGWTFNRTFRCRDHIAKLYLTSQEYDRGKAALDAHGCYVLIEPFTKHQNFRWPVERWNDLVAACSDLTFVQHTHRDSPVIYGTRQESATFREACGLAAACDVYVRSESGMCHAAAALGVPQVTLFGGCMDPEVMGYYPKQTVIADPGEGSPCGRWLSCMHCRQAMQRITVEQVVDAIRQQLQARRAA